MITNVMWKLMQQDIKMNFEPMGNESFCILCSNTREIINRPVRQMGYTFGFSESSDSLEEQFVPCPLCSKQKPRLKELREIANRIVSQIPNQEKDIEGWAEQLADDLSKMTD